ncbi:MAG: pyridoxamine kinase [Ruminococcaceae bacterium]|nr:pyridoxamine kinase [Oscillospiraceae bacterium]
MNQPIKRCAVINDLSGFGRCSLTVAIPVLSALGIQACALPTAILSNHTGFEHFYFEDYTDRMREYASHWSRLGLEFDSIYTGFLGSEKQVEAILEFVEQFRTADTLLFVDPAMADHGELYTTCTAELVDKMRDLVCHADVITPNLTEACLLTGESYHGHIETEGYDKIFALAETLADMGPKQVIITGVKKGDHVANVVVDRTENTRFVVESEHVSCEYCGTGDTFASALCGYLTAGMDLREALEKTSDFVAKTIRYSFEHKLPPLEGVAFEPFLQDL